MIQAAKIIGTGLATTGLMGAGIGIGVVFGGLILGVPRNPSLRGQLFSYAILGFAFSEATGLFALMMAFLFMCIKCTKAFLINNFVVVYNCICIIFSNVYLFIKSFFSIIGFEHMSYNLKMCLVYHLCSIYSQHKSIFNLFIIHNACIMFHVIVSFNFVHFCIFSLLILSELLLVYLLFFDNKLTIRYPLLYIILLILFIGLFIICFAYLSCSLLFELVNYVIKIFTKSKGGNSGPKNSSNSGGDSNGGGPNGGGNQDSDICYNPVSKRKYSKAKKKEADRRYERSGKRNRNRESEREYDRKYYKSDKGKLNRQRKQETDSSKNSQKKYRKSDKGIKMIDKHYNSDKAKETRVVYEAERNIRRKEFRKKVSALLEAVKKA